LIGTIWPSEPVNVIPSLVYLSDLLVSKKVCAVWKCHRGLIGERITRQPSVSASNCIFNFGVCIPLEATALSHSVFVSLEGLNNIK